MIFRVVFEMCLNSFIKLKKAAIKRIKNIKSSVPPLMFYYFLCYLIIQFVLFVFFVPGNDFDSMSLYASALKIKEYGFLKQTAIIDMQYLFPLSFYELHKPLLQLEYFTTLPNFVLFLVFLCLLFKVNRKIYFFSLLWTFSCQLILVQSTSLKHDVSVGILAFIGWFVANKFENKALYLTVCSLILAALIGIKWHGIILALLLAILMIFTIFNKKLINVTSILILFTSLPLLWLVSDAQVYLNNYLDYSNLVPTIPSSINYNIQAKSTLINALKNTSLFVVSNFFDTFNGLILSVDRIWGTNILKLVSEITLSSSNADIRRSTWPSPLYTSFGISILLLLLSNIYALVKKKFSFLTKSAALISLTYMIGMLWLFNYTVWFNRYCLPTFILGIVPASEVTYDFFENLKSAYKIWLSRIIVAYTILVSLHCLILIEQKPLVDFTSKEQIHLPSIWHHVGDRDLLYFYNSRGYMEIYNYFREHILPSDSLLFINNTQELVVSYPFLKDRSPANTLTRSPYNTKGYEQDLGKFDYVMIYRGILEDGRYELVYTYPGRFAMNIYKLENR